MKYFSANEIDVKLQKKLLIGGIIPRPIALVLTKTEENGFNLAPFSYFNIVSYDPGMVSISVQRHLDGRFKDTSKNILNKKFANIHVVDKSIVEEANKTSASLEESESELAMTNFQLANHDNHALPYIEQIKIVYFTKLYKHIEIERDDGSVVADLVVLKVEGTILQDEVFDQEKQYVLPRLLNPVSRLAGNDYADLGEIKTIIRPD